MKSALITGLTGQDGSYLAEFLLEKGYRVRGLARRSSSFNTARIDHLLSEYPGERFNFYRGDLNDGSSLARVLRLETFDEVYHLGAQSHVAVSFEMPEYTLDSGILGFTRLLDVIRDLDQEPRIYVAGSSEMFGSSPPPQSETTVMAPRSPYAIGKMAAFQLARNYREAYGTWISNGILFNHESPRRGETFVTRKITRAVARIALGVQKELRLGNLDAERDWGFAGEYVEAMWLMLQQDGPDDFVIATGESHSVREFCQEAFSVADLDWNEYVVIDPRYFRPTEVDSLRGDARKARECLGWEPRIGFKELVRIMVSSDMSRERSLLFGTASDEGADH